MRVLVAIILLAACLNGCSNVDDANYRDYFSATAVDGKTRHYVYNTVTKEEGEVYNNKAIRRISKISKNRIELVEYTYLTDYDTTIRVDSTIMEMRKDGIYVIKSFINGGDDWQQLSMKSTLSFPYNWEKARDVFTSWKSTYKGEPMESSGEQAFKGCQERNVTGYGKVNVAIREGVQKRIYKGETITSSIEKWDVKGLGLYRYKSITGESSYEMEYECEISKEDYEGYLIRR